MDEQANLLASDRLNYEQSRVNVYDTSDLPFTTEIFS